MIVREANEKDYPSLIEISKRIHDFHGENEIPFYSESLGFELYVLESDQEENIGFACTRLDDDTEAEIDYIAIRQDQEGKGIASAFLREVLADMKENGINKIFLEVRSKNQRAISFYERNNFQQYRVRKHYYNDGDDALCYLWEEKQ